MARRPSEDMLQAYHDDELGLFARWRVGRQLAASPEARAELESLSLVGQLVRESQAAAAVPDLWSSIARELPAASPAPASTGEDGRASVADALGWLFRPAGAAVAAAAAAATAIFVLSGSEPAGIADVVQYLDPGENSVMLFQGQDEATIIWLMEPVTDTSSRESRAFI